MQLGELVGQGRTSNVFAYGTDSVVKVSNPGVPEHWPEFEARVTDAVWQMGCAAPAVRDLVKIKGKHAMVLERIDGPSMWQLMVAEPGRGPALINDLAEIQRSLHSIGLPAGVPELADRLVRKIGDVVGLDDAERDEARALARSLPRGASLLHGDLHPGNVLMGASGPVVIDWFDAVIGHPIYDVVRSSILMQENPVAEPAHLPAATARLLRTIRSAYLDEFRDELDFVRADVPRWQAVAAVGRLAEGAEHDESMLLNHWRARGSSQSG